MGRLTKANISAFSDGDAFEVAPADLALPQPAPASGAIRMLRLLLVGVIVIPLGLGIAAGYFSYRDHFARAKTALVETVAAAEENTIKVLDTHQLVAARIDDLLSSLSDQDIRAQEQTLHDRLAQQIKDLPQVAAAWALDANGRELVSARVYPVNRDLDHSGRDDFQALKNSQQQTFIWALRARSLDKEGFRPYFTVTRRREGPDGQFRGITIAAVSGTYFASFYNSLLGGSSPGNYTVGIFREDGLSLARYPEEGADTPVLQRYGPLAQAIASKSSDGLIVTGSPLDPGGQIVAYRRVGDYPVYVTVSRTEASILKEWLVAMRGYIAIGVPAALALVLLCLVALRRTRREQAALAHARDAIAQRAAVESRLHQAQKMEAVGQVSAGIAHDFNNLLTIIKGNIAMLQMRLEDAQPGLKNMLSEAMIGCERASSLTRRLLSFSRNEPINPQPTDVNAVITAMSDLLARSMGDRIRCKTELAGSLWVSFVDPNQLENSLINLAVNARDAMPAGGHLTIATANRTIDHGHAAAQPRAIANEYVEISVSDTGSGMPPEVRKRAFDPFFTTKDPGKGTGLGLSQVYAFADAAGGYCVLESAPGSGTTVRLRLPRYIGPLPEAALEAPGRASQRQDSPIALHK